MTIKPHSCIEVVCDADPGCDPWEDTDSGATPHFTTEAEARECLTGWRWRDDGTAICDRHAAREDCEREGHIWHAPPLAGVRFCERDGCGAYETVEVLT